MTGDWDIPSVSVQEGFLEEEEENVASLCTVSYLL